MCLASMHVHVCGIHATMYMYVYIYNTHLAYKHMHVYVCVCLHINKIQDGQSTRVMTLPHSGAGAPGTSGTRRDALELRLRFTGLLELPSVRQWLHLVLIWELFLWLLGYFWEVGAIREN